MVKGGDFLPKPDLVYLYQYGDKEAEKQNIKVTLKLK